MISLDDCGQVMPAGYTSGVFKNGPIHCIAVIKSPTGQHLAVTVTDMKYRQFPITISNRQRMAIRGFMKRNKVAEEIGK